MYVYTSDEIDEYSLLILHHNHLHVFHVPDQVISLTWHTYGHLNANTALTLNCQYSAETLLKRPCQNIAYTLDEHSLYTLPRISVSCSFYIFLGWYSHAHCYLDVKLWPLSLNANEIWFMLVHCSLVATWL